MSDPQKPLHVRVAEALGWTEIHRSLTPPCAGDILIAQGPGTGCPDYRWHGRRPGNMLVGKEGREDLVPEFTTVWSATGPLIEKHKIVLAHDPTDESPWAAIKLRSGIATDDVFPPQGDGPTPLIAVCELLLKLAEAGKLAQEREQDQAPA